MLVFRIVVTPLLLAFLGTTPGFAQEYVGRTPPRLSLVEGKVSLWPSGGEAWERADLNLPLAPGDFLSTGPGSRAELQIGPRAFLRLADSSQVGIDDQQEDYLRIEVVDGRVGLDARSLPTGVRVHLRTPHGTLALYDPGFYEVIVTAERTSFIAHRDGHGTVFAESDFDTLQSGEEVVRRSAGNFEHFEAPPYDSFARWNIERTDNILSRLRQDYVPEDIYGLDELEQHGRWSDEPDFGRVWMPLHVSTTWAPYTTGRWYWDVGYGWTWIDSSPWGWAPYHYGRWVRVHSRWAWAPGPRYGRPIYAPALVAFLHEPGLTIAVGGPVSWVALGWGEPVLPWWGPTWYRGRPCWDGWGGPTYVNRHRVDRHHKFDHHDIPRYDHQDHPDAVVVVDRHDFGRRTTTRPHAPRVNRERLRPADQPPVQPRDVGVPERGERTRPPRPERERGRQPQSPRDDRPGSGEREAAPPRSEPSAPMPGTQTGPRYERPEGRRAQPPQAPRNAPVDAGAKTNRPSPYDRIDRPTTTRPRPEREEPQPRRAEPPRQESIPAPRIQPIPEQRDPRPRVDPYGRPQSQPRPKPHVGSERHREPNVSAPSRPPSVSRPQSAPVERPPRIEQESRPERHSPYPTSRERPSRPQENMRPSRDSRDSDDDSDGGSIRSAPRQPQGGGASRPAPPPQRVEPPAP